MEIKADIPMEEAGQAKPEMAAHEPSSAVQPAEAKSMEEEVSEAMAAPAPEKKKFDPNIKLFNRWPMVDLVLTDKGLASIMNIDPIIVPRTGGKFATTYMHKSKVNIVERLITKMMVPGHKGKKHKYTSGRCPASTQAIMKALIEAFGIIETKTKQNPVQILIKAVENAALNEEIAAYRMGGTIARQAVTTSPRRRLDLSLRHITQGIYRAKFNRKTPLPSIIADELMAAAANDPKSFAVQERSRIEKEAEGAR
jgi:small subunit ribosomal protein S7